ncbi:NADP-dependent oxidoreductase [Aeromicrobium endophyticum]|uniref:NADP-dependent oxidoreductase n=1 Tax=Aeromicrobium endophyticum TaxID=2292704 RepID=A0A371P9X9_9ACTN|nr:NADP-dependent oxidoreductase [Aeromicrobium endophyticum]REK72754.1 NADP-dependent oxidoreductase [Aeromicrobium endophyticum]
MKAIQFHEYGTPDVLQYADVDLPTPAAGQVRIRVAGTSFNSVDGNIRAGFMQEPMPLTLPHTPGLDVAGTVDEVGDGFTDWAAGDEVVGFLPFTVDGAAAEYVLAAADGLARAPRSIPLADAAALPLVGLTAWQALFVHADLKAGQRILVTGAAGAVGGYAVQLAAAAGAHVIASTSAGGADQARTHGAHEVVGQVTAGATAVVGEPVDALLNLAPIDPETFAALATNVRDGGVVVNTTVWMPAPSDEARGVRGVDMYVASDAAQLAGLVERVDRGELTVDVAHRVPLRELPAVHAAAADGTLRGKVVIVP